MLKIIGCRGARFPNQNGTLETFTYEHRQFMNPKARPRQLLPDLRLYQKGPHQGPTPSW